MIAHDFILDLLYPLPVRTKKMFGNFAIYLGDRILLATRHKQDKSVDNGIWVGTALEYHNTLKQLIPSLRHLETYKIKKWLLLPETADDFEDGAQKIVDLIKGNSELIGVVVKISKNN